MNWLDLVLLVGAIAAIFVGYQTGLLKVALTLGAGVMGLLLAG